MAEGIFDKKDMLDKNKYAAGSRTPNMVKGVYSTEFKKELEKLVYKYLSSPTPDNKRLAGAFLDPEDARGVSDVMLNALIREFNN